MKDVLYMAVSRDEYELPLIVADTVSEIARKTGHNIGTLYRAISQANGNCLIYGQKAKIIKVNLEDTMARKGKFKALPGDEIIVFSKPKGHKEPIKIHCKVTEINETKLHAVNCSGYNRWLTFASHKKMWISEDEDDA